MKDKIKWWLTVALSTINTPFFVVRVLIMIIPMAFVYAIADYTDADDDKRFVASVIWAICILGPLGMILRKLLRKWYEIDDYDMRNYLIDEIEKNDHK